MLMDKNICNFTLKEANAARKIVGKKQMNKIPELHQQILDKASSPQLGKYVWENGVGIEIFANKTAKQTPVSALSSIHAREVCIYIQDNVESILKRYNWEANTARHREEIKTLVDTFLTNVKQGDGIYDFKTVMDTTNNTSEVIDRNMGVIDIYIEVVRGLEILAQRLTVLKTGTIESGNFE